MPELFAQISYLNLCCEMAQPALSTHKHAAKIKVSSDTSSSVSLLQKFLLKVWLIKCACITFWVICFSNIKSKKQKANYTLQAGRLFFPERLHVFSIKKICLYLSAKLQCYNSICTWTKILFVMFIFILLLYTQCRTFSKQV